MGQIIGFANGLPIEDESTERTRTAHDPHSGQFVGGAVKSGSKKESLATLNKLLEHGKSGSAGRHFDSPSIASSVFKAAHEAAKAAGHHKEFNKMSSAEHKAAHDFHHKEATNHSWQQKGADDHHALMSTAHSALGSLHAKHINS